MSVGTIKGIEQGRAAFAYKCVKDILSKYNKDDKDDKKVRKEYKSHTKEIPILIKTNGLGQTFAFVNSKKDKAYEEIYTQTKEWFVEKDFIEKEEDLLEKIVKMESSKYRQQTMEAIAFFVWLRRFADGLIKDEDDKGKRDEVTR